MILEESMVKKADGELEPFDPAKLAGSLERSGATAAVAEDIVHDIEGQLYNGITTSEIYRHAFQLLREHKRTIAARYSLKRAIFDFGPSGFPFEAYLGELFRAQGYDASVDQIVHGGCVEHEVDVVATKNGETTYVEAKFHNDPGYTTDLKVALYVKARIDDIRKKSESPDKVHGLLVTNTRFTSIAINYANCAGIALLGWDYPHKGNLHDMIDSTKRYPITTLTTLSRYEKDELLQNKIVLCNDLPEQAGALSRIGIRGRRAEAIFDEARGLCVPHGGIQ